MTREGQMETEIGPVDYMIVAFPGSKFRGEIAPALGKLVDSGTIRIIDVAFVSKSENGDILAAEITELDPDVQEGLEKLGIEVEGLFNEEDLEAAGEELEPGSSAALLVWENVWAARPPRRSATQAACSSTSSGFPTRSSRPPATGRSPTARGRRSRCH